MNLPFSVVVALRYLFSKKSTNVINVITGISMFGMAVVSMALVVVLSVFNGLEDLVISLHSTFTPDLIVLPASGKVFAPTDEQLHQLQHLDGVERISQTLQEKALLKYQENEYIATVKGVDNHYLTVTNLKSALIKGNFLLQQGEEDYMILGAGIKARLGVSLEDRLNAIAVSFPRRGRQATGMLPSDVFVRKFIFPSGIVSVQQGFDEEYVFVPLRFIQHALRYDKEISSLEIKINSRSDIHTIKKNIRALLGPGYIVKDRLEQDEALFRVMQMERFAVYAILCFILLIASFNIIGSLTMIALEKTKDIAVLKSLGASHAWIRQVFLLKGIVSALIAGTTGIFAGIILCWVQMQFGLVPLAGSGSFVVKAYPVKLQVFDLLMTLIIVVCISLLASLIPAWRATQQNVRLNIR